MVRLTSLRTLNDFRLLQLAWIYDLNFIPSLAMVLERSVIEQLTASMPQSDELSRVVGNLRTMCARVSMPTRPGESRSERIPHSLLRGQRAIRIISSTLRIEAPRSLLLGA